MGTRKLMTTGWMREEMMKVIEIIDVFNFMLIVLPLYPKTAEGYVDCFDAAQYFDCNIFSINKRDVCNNAGISVVCFERIFVRQGRKI